MLEIDRKTFSKRSIRHSFKGHLKGFIKILNRFIKKTKKSLEIINFLEKYQKMFKFIELEQTEKLKRYFNEVKEILIEYFFQYKKILNLFRCVPKNISASELNQHFFSLNDNLMETRNIFGKLEAKSMPIKQIILNSKIKVKNQIVNIKNNFKNIMLKKLILLKLSRLFLFFDNLDYYEMWIDLYIDGNYKYQKDLEILSYKNNISKQRKNEKKV
ncbi:MAG: hypothetical protein ACTSQP_23800 [Promethearchaeota archaeon]